MKSIYQAIGFCILTLSAQTTHAEKVDMSPKQLREIATHILVGTVAQIYERGEVGTEWNTTHYLAEIQIQSFEKGNGLKTGELIYVRYWTRNWIGAQPKTPAEFYASGMLDTRGHRGLPKKGETVRIYLARNGYDGFGVTTDGGFNVLGANGFEKPTPH